MRRSRADELLTAKSWCTMSRESVGASQGVKVEFAAEAVAEALVPSAQDGRTDKLSRHILAPESSATSSPLAGQRATEAPFSCFSESCSNFQPASLASDPVLPVYNPQLKRDPADRRFDSAAEASARSAEPEALRNPSSQVRQTRWPSEEEQQQVSESSSARPSTTD